MQMILSKLKINYIPELLALLFGRLKPSMVSVNLTEKCNQNCIYCEIGKNTSSEDKHLLTNDDLFWIIDQMKINKIKRLSMCGGEPFLFDGIFDVVAYAWKNNIRCNITSNGMIVCEIAEAELKILKDCETVINISIDSFNDSIQAQTRGVKSALTNAIKSIQRLQQMGIPVTVLTAISKYNYHDLFNSLIKANEYGFSQILYQPIISYSNYPDRQVIKNKSRLNVDVENINFLRDQLQKINQFEKKNKISTNVYRIIPWISSYLKGATKL
jgi:MoaA/NifB/PqqE/SkfB family radical SAM enzyme